MDRPFAFDNAPDAMLVERRWVGWRLEPKPDRPKPTKVPYRADGGKAASTRPDEWCSWREAVAAVARHNLTGIGFVLGGGWVGVDVDHSVADGKLNPLAEEVVADLGGYAEISPSGTGIHVIVRGEMPHSHGRKKKDVEMYAGGRFFTFTGWWLGQGKDESGYSLPAPDPTTPGPEKLRAFYDRHFPPEPARPPVAGFGLGVASFRQMDRPEREGKPDPTTMTDDELLRRIAASKQGPKFEALFDGQWQSLFSSHSEADASLVGILRFWTDNDEERIDRLFRRSRLMREKWDSKRGQWTYGQRTIKKIGGG